MPFEGPTQDYIAIQQLVSGYGDAVSRLHLEDFTALWTEDAVWIHPRLGEIAGRAAIVETCRAALGRMEALLFTSSLGSLRVTGDEAAGRVWVEEVVRAPGAAPVRQAGRYDDVYRRQDGAWLFSRREMTILHRG